MGRGMQLHLKSNLIPSRDPCRTQAKPCVHQSRGKGVVTPTRDWAKPTFECLRVFCGGMNQQWPAVGTEALATPVLGGMAYSLLEEIAINPTIELPSGQLTNWRTKFSHCCKSSRPNHRLPNLGIHQRDWVSPGNLTLKVSKIWLQNLQRTGETDSWGAQTKSCAQQDSGERSSDPTRRLSQTCLCVLGSLWQRHGLTVAYHRVRILPTIVLGGPVCWQKSSWRRLPLSPLLPLPLP